MCFCAARSNQYRDLKWRGRPLCEWGLAMGEERYNEEGSEVSGDVEVNS